MRWTLYRVKIGYIYAVNYCWFLWWFVLCLFSKICDVSDKYPRGQLATCNPDTKIWATTANPAVASLIRNIIAYANQLQGTDHDGGLTFIRDRIPHSYIAWLQYYDMFHDCSNQLVILQLLLNLKIITPSIYMELQDPAHEVYRKTDMLCDLFDRPRLDYQQLIDHHTTIKE